MSGIPGIYTNKVQTFKLTVISDVVGVKMWIYMLICQEIERKKITGKKQKHIFATAASVASEEA